MSTTWAVSVTLLPNGIVAGKLRLSVALNPTVTGTLADSAFADWPSQLTKMRDALSHASICFRTPPCAQSACEVLAAGIKVDPVSAEEDAHARMMWAALFAGEQTKSHERKALSDTVGNLGKKWMLSHDAAALHYVHTLHRQDRFKVAMGVGGDAAVVNAQQELINIYLHPNLRPAPESDSVQTPLSFGKLVDARNAALIFCQVDLYQTAGLSDSFKDLLKQRFNHAWKLLERGEERLLDIGIYAACMSCIDSLAKHIDPNNATIQASAALVTKPLLNQVLGWRNGSWETGIDPVAFDQAVRYVEFLLFSRRSLSLDSAHTMQDKSGPSDTEDTDFHHIIDFLRRFPALLRPLGLVFDITCDLPTNAVPDGDCTISMRNLSAPSGVLPPVLPGVPAQQFTIFWTACHLQRPTAAAPGEFYAANAVSAGAPATGLCADFTYKRFLNLGASVGDASVYTLVTVDAENETHKRFQNSKATSSSSEYESTANHPAKSSRLKKVKTNKDLKKLPSTRTCGISLLHSQRVERIQAVARRVSDPNLGSETMPFFADDLILGYRVDVRLHSIDGKPGRWYALGDRASTYTMTDAAGVPIGPPWSPTSPLELEADAGFVSAAATSTAEDGDKAAQLQAHPALFTWSGAGMGYVGGNAKSEAINSSDQADEPIDPSQVRLRMLPAYRKNGNLLQLRFKHTYDVRCRIVDIAGNSAPKNDNTSEMVVPTGKPGAVMSIVMQRHEPLRSPQVLLSQTIDRKQCPGTQANHLVVRRRGEEDIRTLVPPSEGLRFAFMHGVVHNDETTGAFGNIDLMPNGSFPLAEAAPADKKSKDAIFRYKRRGGAIDAPFFPDPLADQLRIHLDAWSLPFDGKADDLTTRLVDTFNFYTDAAEWPFVSPCRLRVVAGDESVRNISARRIKMPLADNAPSHLQVEGLEVILPPGAIVELLLTCAAYNCDRNGKALSGQVHARVAPAIKSGAALLLAALGEAPLPIPYRSTSALEQYLSVNAPLPPPSPGGPAPGGPVILQMPPPAQGVDPTFQLATCSRILHSDHGGPPRPPALHPPRLVPESASMAALSGFCEIMTPGKSITLVHAIRKPHKDAAPQGGFDFQRPPGGSAAFLKPALPGDDDLWTTTAKIACNASWMDMVDDLTKPGPVSQPVSEMVFEISEKDWDNKISVIHHLRDTRAHCIQYQLSASSRFREYFPAGDKETDFVRTSPTMKSFPVRSSVRPPAPALLYCVPAFAWREDDEPGCRGWVRQRSPAIRCYHERPFLISGDLEKLGVVLLGTGQTDNEKQPGAGYISRMGHDPLWQEDGGAESSSALRAEALSGYEHLYENIQLAEDAAFVNVAVFRTIYSVERQLWFCDIPFNVAGSYAPFVRLAMVRFQEQGQTLEVDLNEARLSSVVFADFCQVAPNRFAAVQRQGREVILTVSGDAYRNRAGSVLQTPADAGKADARPLPVPFDNTLEVEVQHRLHEVLNFDPGWRPLSMVVPPPEHRYESGTVTWTFRFTLPHSPTWFKYRLALQESETFYADSDLARTPSLNKNKPEMFSESGPDSVKPVQRPTYFDFFEL